MDPGKDHTGSTFCAPDPKIYLPFRPPAGDPPPWEKPKIPDMIKPRRYFGPDSIIPPVRCARYFDPDNPDGPPYVLYAGPDPIIPPVKCGGPDPIIPPVKCRRDPDSDEPPYKLYAGPDPIIPPVRCVPFRPIPPEKCVPTGGGPIGDPPPWGPEPEYPIW